MAALTVRFNELVYLEHYTRESYFQIGILLVISGIFLGQLWGSLFSKVKQYSSGFLGLGVLASSLLFIVIAVSEDRMSEKELCQKSELAQFSSVKNHCGIYAGNLILSFIHRMNLSENEFQRQEFNLASTFRIRHFELLKKKGLLGCQSGEDLIECRTRWMNGFSEQGFWEYRSRLFFFNELISLWENSKNETALINYVLKDQEFESAKQSLPKQWGIEEELNDRILLIQQTEELNNLKLTDKIFQETTVRLSSLTGTPTPLLFRFKDAQSDAQVKINHVAEIESDIEQLKKRITK